MDQLKKGLRRGLFPIAVLSSNWISMIGVVLVTTAAILWLFLLPVTLAHETGNAYTGILSFMILPALFFGGLALIPLGSWLFRRRGKNELGALEWSNPKVRRTALFIALTTAANLVIGSHLAYSAVHYMESVAFCGQTCHTVMQPEYTAYINSPHARVECVKCHIGPGASWFVKSKLSGAWQVIAVTINSYPRPIPTPVENLRPARETCETCHWPQKYGQDRMRVIPTYASDEANTLTRTVLLMRIGGGTTHRGIHGAHFGPGVRIRYAPADRQRQQIPWVEYRNGAGELREYRAADAKGALPGNLEAREMDCVDCHNRPTHIYEMPERGVDHLMQSGQVSPSLPFVKKTAVELLKKDYPTHEAAATAIAAGFEGFYRENKPDVFRERGKEIEQAAKAVAGLYQRNVFPAMKITWGTYPNNIGHTDFTGCFRCHDERPATGGAKTLTQDCNTCHQLLAMDEAEPKILADLGEK
ncbi:MAG: cytochrome c3 family protein [Bryobacteraceae bacterium]|nr:cytochrome c3 family protein [Bryobacteraceae bacterium]